MADDTVTLSIEGPDGESEVTLPTHFLDLLLEDDDETTASVVGDLVMMNCAQQLHAAVHHAHGEPSEEIKATEAAALELFEERFGQTLGEMTGHQH
jgi:hypothetical protein